MSVMLSGLGGLREGREHRAAASIEGGRLPQTLDTHVILLYFVTTWQNLKHTYFDLLCYN